MEEFSWWHVMGAIILGRKTGKSKAEEQEEEKKRGRATTTE
jgi:hypothetical protein